jgi:hypothetical protein
MEGRMASRPWTVLPHDPILKHEANLWTVRGVTRTGAVMDRRMAVVKLEGDRLLFFNAVPLEEPAMKELEAWGKPAYLVVPNGYHRLDIHAFKARYPGMKLVAPAPAIRKVQQVAAVDGDLTTLPIESGLVVEALEGTTIGEPALVVTSEGRRSVVFGDAVMNLEHGGGFEGFVLKLLGSTGGPRVTRIARWFLVSDAARLRSHLEMLAALPELVRLIPSHGKIIEGDAPRVLREVAAGLK